MKKIGKFSLLHVNVVKCEACWTECSDKPVNCKVAPLIGSAIKILGSVTAITGKWWKIKTFLI